MPNKPCKLCKEKKHKKPKKLKDLLGRELTKVEVDNKVLFDLTNSLISYSESVDSEIREKGKLESVFFSSIYHHYLLLMIELETYLGYNFTEVLKEIENK